MLAIVARWWDRERRAGRLEETGDRNMRLALRLVELEVDLDEVRSVNCGDDLRQNLKQGPTRIAGKDREGGIALRFVSALIHEGLHGSVAFMERTRPTNDTRPALARGHQRVSRAVRRLMILKKFCSRFSYLLLATRSRPKCFATYMA